MATPNIVPRADSEGGIGTASKYWASAYIDTIYVGAGKVGRDADNNLDFSTDNNIFFKINGGNEIVMDANRIYPAVNGGSILGHPSYQWADLFLHDGAVINFNDGNVTLTHTNNKLIFGDSDQLGIGNDADLVIYHDTQDTYITNDTGDLEIKNNANDKDIIFKSDDGSGGTETYFFLDGSAGRTIFPDNKILGIGTGTDLYFVHDASNSYINANGTGDLVIKQMTDDKDISFQCDDGSGGTTEYFRLDGGDGQTNVSRNIKFYDTVQAWFGDGNDLRLTHDGTNSYIQNYGGNLLIKNQTNDGDMVFYCDDGAGSEAIYFYLDGSSATHDGSATTGLYTNWPDYSRISLGTGHDMLMYHDGTQTVYQNRVGNFYITQAADDLDIIFQCDDGSGGTTPYITLDGSVAKTIFSKPIEVGADGAGHDVKFFLNASGRYIMIDEDDNSLTFSDNAIGKFGSGGDLQLLHDGTDSRIDNMVGHIKIRNYSDDSDIIFETDSGSGGTMEYLRIDGGETKTIFFQETRHNDSVSAKFGNSGDLTIQHDSNNSYITANGTGDLYIKQMTADKDITFQCDDGSGSETEYFRLDGSSTNILASQNINLIDDKAVLFGTGSDAFFKHTGSQFSFFNDTGPVIFYQRVDDGYIAFQSDDGSGGLTEYFRVDGQNEIVKFSKDSRHNDNVKANFGTGNDLQIYHGGTNSLIQNATGNLSITNNTDDGDIIFSSDDGSGGTAAYLTIDGSAHVTVANKHIQFPDTKRAYFGDGFDFEIYHDGTDSRIYNAVGDFVFRNSQDDGDVKFQCDDGSGGVTTYITLDGGDVSTIVSTIKVMMPNLPTSNPSTAGQLWNDSGTLKISAG